MNFYKKVITDIELHSSGGIRECFENGVSPDYIFKGRPLIYELIGGYKRGASFKECVKVFVEFNVKFNDKTLLAVLMDNSSALEYELKKNPEALNNKYTFDCAFTPFDGASLLHICSEYNHISCAKILSKHGANVNAKAGIDKNGFGGQTPIFHTVNQHDNLCIETMKYLISQSADLIITIEGLIWGKGYDWETFIPAVNPVSYALMGLLPQFHRRENQVYEVVEILIKEAYGTNYKHRNIPNKYLKNKN